MRGSSISFTTTMMLKYEMVLIARGAYIYSSCTLAREARYTIETMECQVLLY